MMLETARAEEIHAQCGQQRHDAAIAQAEPEREQRQRCVAALSGQEQFGAPRLERKQRALSVETAGVSRKAAVRAQDAVAGNDDPDRVASGRGARGARAARATGPLGKLAVGYGLAEADASDRCPYRSLKRRALGRERDVETLALAAEIFGQLALRLAQRRMLRVPPPLRRDVRQIFLAVEVNASKSFFVRNEQHLPLRACIEIVVAHG